MGLFSFIGDVGKKVFGNDAADTDKRTDIHNEINALELPAQISVDMDGKTVTLEGNAADQASKEKIILAAGNIEGVDSVQDNIIVAPADADAIAENPETNVEAVFVTVQQGDTLWKIAENSYGDGNQYNAIFEANKPMLKSADAIFVGQTLRIPARKAA
ncbi:MAG: nucleoid-associated protein YgaU [Alphaproteobacteria bacterium]|jgi:nucleoid-associated protein YgaU